MVVLTALTDDKRWAGVYPTRKPRGARASNPINLPSQRLELGSHGLGRSEGVAPKGTSTWGNKLMPPASNAWVSPSLPYPKNDGASGSPSHIDDRPSSRGSSTSSSTVGSDFLDLPSYHLPTAANHSLSTETRSGSLQLSRFPDSFTNALKAPLRTIGKRSPTSHAKGFSLSMDDFPTLGTKNSESNSQQVGGRRLQGRPSFGSGTVVAQDEQRKGLKTGVAEVISSPNYEHENILRTCYVYEGDDPVPAAKLTREAQAQQAQLHGTQAPNICMPPPWSEYWHPSPDHPPDRNGMLHKGEAPYVPYKRADPPGSLPVESFAHCDQLLLNHQASARQDTRHGDYYSDNDPYHPHTPADCCVINQPPHILGKVKDDRSDALEKQPIIKKDVALLEKIKCLNNKARNLRALNLSELSSSKESKVKHPKDIGVEADHVTKDAPSSAATSEIVPAFNKLNSISESSNSLPNNPPNVPANGVIAVGLSEGQVTEFGEARKPSKPADYHAYGRGNTSRNRLDDSAKDMPSSICGHVWEEHSTVESLRGVVMTDAQHGEPSSRNTSQQAHVTAAYKLPNWPDYEVQYARMRYLSAQAAKQLQDAEDWISQQKANAIAKLEELSRRPSVESQKSNDAPPEADNLYCKQKTGGDETIKRDSSTADTRCIVSADGLNAPQPANGGVSKGLLIHNVMSSAKNTEVNMMEHIIHKSTSQSHDNSAPRHWQMENRRRQFDSRERNKRDMSNVAETPVDTQSTEAKPHDDFSTRNKNSRRDSAAVRPAAPPVIGNENNTTEVSSMHKTHLPCVAINGSMIPAQVTSVTGVMVGSIMLADVPLASVKQECAAAAKEVHDTTNSFSRPQQIKKSGKNQHGALPIENLLWNDSVMCTPIKQPSKKEQHEEGSPNSMAVAAPTRLSGNHIIVSENVATMKRTEIDWYAHMPIYKEPHQLNLGKILPAENHTSSYDNWAKSNLEAKSHDKEALANFNASKAEVTTDLDWLDRKTSWDHEGRPCASWKQKSTDGLALVVQNLAEPAGYFNVADVVQESSDQWRQVEEQFESKIHDAIEDRLKPTQTIPLPSSAREPLPVNTWESHRASDYQRHYHVKGQRNVGSSYGYKDRVGRGRFFHETPALSRARWIPKYISHPQSNAQDSAVSEWLCDSRQGLSDTDNSHGLDSKLTRIFDSDGGMDLQGEQVNVGMSFEDESLVIWNEREWEYQQVYGPAPHRLGQHDERGRGGYGERGCDAGEPTCDANDERQKGRRGSHSEYQAEPVGTSSDAAPDIKWYPSGAHERQSNRSKVHPTSSRAGAYMERRCYI